MVIAISFSFLSEMSECQLFITINMMSFELLTKQCLRSVKSFHKFSGPELSPKR